MSLLNPLVDRYLHSRSDPSLSYESSLIDSRSRYQNSYQSFRIYSEPELVTTLLTGLGQEGPFSALSSIKLQLGSLFLSFSLDSNLNSSFIESKAVSSLSINLSSNQNQLIMRPKSLDFVERKRDLGLDSAAYIAFTFASPPSPSPLLSSSSHLIYITSIVNNQTSSSKSFSYPTHLIYPYVIYLVNPQQEVTVMISCGTADREVPNRPFETGHKHSLFGPQSVYPDLTVDQLTARKSKRTRLDLYSVHQKIKNNPIFEQQSRLSSITLSRSTFIIVHSTLSFRTRVHHL
ncbi:hypothetical protein CROQUDRAFT_98829 [Cronartium quercuum f. sp. fusiforme G11]|uniref:Uncharacterized protein n=1 Tax=Cronartium quercuum f. sp. fusiforme G11 TaxID=708437 RepID=A0A9P6N841_9BASI|nr:hypothetical protein CROQUDRAFT_98829 [Cronartium quercuum f. sp. fusiforme G11]